MIEKTNKKLVFHSVLIFFAILILTCVVVFVDAFSHEKSLVLVKRMELESNEDVIMTIEATLLGNEMDTVIGDLLFLSDLLYMDQIRSGQHVSTKNKWQLFARSNFHYDNLSLIDANGDEVFKIMQQQDDAVPASRGHLFNQKSERYFIETIKLQDRQIYVSPITVYVEDDQPNKQHEPNIRLSTPVYIDDEFIGIVSFCYRADKLLDEFYTIAENSHGIVYFVNADGSYILTDNTNEAVSNEQPYTTFANDFAEEWQAMVEESGSIETDRGLFTYSNVSPETWLPNCQVQEQDDHIVFGDEMWHIISQIPSDGGYAACLNISDGTIARSVFQEDRILFIMAGICALMFTILIHINRRRIQKIRFFSEHDTLTGVFNRRAGLIKLKDNLQSAAEMGTDLSICFSDVNGLKDINDTLGHESGDAMLKTFIHVANNEIDGTDYIMRLGGDEFLIIFVGATRVQAEATWSRIVARLNHINETENRPYNISLSHGVVEASNKIANEIIRMADEKMYIEKRQQKQQFCAIKAQ